MKFETEILECARNWVVVLLVSLSLNSCWLPEEPEPAVSNEKYGQLILLAYLLREYECSKPNAIGIDSVRSNCINDKLDSGLIYDYTTGLPISTASVSNGTQLECRDIGGRFSDRNIWYKSILEPIPSGYVPIFVVGQDVVKDGLGRVTSYKPFTGYSTGDLLICIPGITRSDPLIMSYQTIKIQ